MSSGYLCFTFKNIKVKGDFINGKLIKGTIIDESRTLTGTFIDGFQLHGDNCKAEYENYTYEGKFIKGKISEGKLIVAGNVIEEGKYYPKLRNSKYPVLMVGTKFKNNRKLIGKFHHIDCHLIEGKVVIGENLLWEGHFNSNGIMYKGGVEHKLSKGIFKVIYEVKYDNTVSEYLYQYCVVNWDHNFDELPKHLAFALLCSMGNAPSIHKFCHRYLTNIIPDGYKFLNSNTFNISDPNDKIMYKVILSYIQQITSNKRSIPDNEENIDRSKRIKCVNNNPVNIRERYDSHTM